MRMFVGAPPKHHGPGVEGEDPPAGQHNPPGLPRLSYRVGVYGTFLERMLARLRTQRVRTDSGQSTTPLANLNVDDPGDIALALMKAWAVVGDVLTFYQERIANEGYWRTATEHFSVIALARGVGYESHPGLAAATELAFTLAAPPAAPAKIVIPAGTSVMSTPVGGGQPQTFETIKEIEADAAWNSLSPHVPVVTARQRLDTGSNELRLAGVTTRLKPADPLLLVGEATTTRDKNTGPTPTCLRVVKSVAPDKDAGYTLVTLEPRARDPEAGAALVNPKVFAFRQQASLFGFNAPDWNSAADNIRRRYGTIVGGPFVRRGVGAAWQSQNDGLPAGKIRAVVVGGDGSFFASVAGRGVYRLAPGAAAWVSASTGLTRSDLYSLAVGESGHLFAGASGGVFRSTDGGDSWVRMSWTRAPQPSADGAQGSAGLPATTVRAVSVSTDTPTGTTRLLIGTDNGVFLALDDFSGWTPYNKGLPNTGDTADDKTGLTSTAVLTLFVAGPNIWYAGTGEGVYRWDGMTWTAFNAGLPLDAKGRPPAVFKLVGYTETAPGSGPSTVTGIIVNRLTAATSAGVYLGEDGRGWKPAGGLPIPGATGGAATPALVNALDVYKDAHGVAHILAATGRGLYVSRDDGASWQGTDSTLVQPLFKVSAPSREVIADLDRAEIANRLRLRFRLHSFKLSDSAFVEHGFKWRVRDDELGRTYVLLSEGDDLGVYLLDADVTAVAAGAGGEVIAVVPPGGVAETEWPDFTVKSPRLDLDSIRKGILPGSHVAVTQPPNAEGAPEVLVCTALESSAAPVSAYTRTSAVTSIETDAGEALSLFDRRTTAVLLQSEPLELFETRPQTPSFVRGGEIVLDGLVPDFGAGRKIVVSGRRASAVVAADLGGVVRLADAGREHVGPSNTDVTALAVDARNNLLAGTRGAGLLLLGADVRGGPRWRPLQTGAAGGNVSALAVDGGGNVWAAFEGGALFRADDPHGGWKPVHLPVKQNVPSLAFTPRGLCFAATDGGGVFRSADGDTWEATTNGLTDLHVTSLLADSLGRVFAGTRGGGVFVSADQGGHWGAVNEGLENLSVSALAVGGAGRLYAATRGGGVFVSTNRGGRWNALNDGLTNRNVRALAADDSRGAVYAGTRGGGVFRLREPGGRWKSLDTGASNDVRALALGRDGAAYAGTRKAALMVSADGASFKRLENVPADFALPSKFQPDFDLGVIPSEAKKIFETNNAPLGKDAGLVIQQRGSLWLVTGDEGDLYLIKNEAGQLKVYRPNYALQVAAPPSASADGATLGWRLLDDSGDTYFINARADEILLAPASRQSRPTAEPAVARRMRADTVERRSVVTLDGAPLGNVYDAQTVSVYANVAAATHGETVPLEVLGSGNSSQTGQRFVLKKPPLTYVPSAAVPSGASTLKISVAPAAQEGPTRIEPGSLMNTAAGADVNVPWREVDTLYDARAHERAYMVRAGEHGQTHVIFGDGVNGARLPSGRGNVVAGYRSGVGSAGNLDAGRLTILKSRKAGVRSVTNPTPASGGRDPQTADSARALAPLSLRTLNRIVSLTDYEDFLRATPGVGKVSVKAFDDRGGPVAHVTVAADGGGAVAKDSDFYQSLVNAVAANSAPSQKFLVESYQQLLFNLSAHVIFDGRLKRGVVADDITAALSQAFSFDRRDFGQDVEAPEVVALIQSVRGVLSVRLEALHLVGSSAGLNARLNAEPARRDPAARTIRPAQLLLLNPRGGVRLELEAAP